MAKKIIAIVSLAIVAVFIVATIVMANIKVNYGITCATPDEIRISYGNLTQADSVTKEQKASIVKMINNASKETSLTALFNGTLFKHADVLTVNNADVSQIVTNANAFYVNYVYFTPQTLKVGNKNYKENGETYIYKELCFEVKQTDGKQEVNVYIIKDSTARTSYSKYYLLTADFNELYNFLNEIK